jgi:hypothetical protein
VLVVGICVGGYHYSLFTLLHELLLPTPLAYVGLVPLISALLCTALAPRAADEPDIHDPYLDWILGLPLLGTALAIVEIAPIQLSTYFWLWRLDLLSLPLFVAGAVGLAFGARALWRLRVPIAFLALAWPAPYVVALSPFIGLVAFALVSLAVVVLLLRSRLRVGQPALVGRAAGGRATLALPSRLSVRQARLALMVALVAGAIAATASESLRQFELVATPLGQPVLQPSAVASHPVPGWAVTKTDSFAWITTYLGKHADWNRYQYTSAVAEAAAPQPGSVSSITLDLLTTSSRHALSSYGLQSAYHLFWYQLMGTSPVDIGGGVIGRLVVYRRHSSPLTWMAVYWDWPVQTESGLAYERVVLNVTNRDGAGARAFLVGFSRQVVLASAGRLA